MASDKRKNINLAILITGLGVGGAEQHLLKILPQLKNIDITVISLTNNNNIGKQIEKKGIKVHYLGMTKLNVIPTICKLRRLLKKIKPDVLDTYLIHANILGRLFGRVQGVKCVINSVRNDYSDLALLNFIDKITKRRVDLYVPNSKALVSYLHNKNKVPLRKIKVLPNGIDDGDLTSKINRKANIHKELGLPTKSIVILSTSRLEKQKSLDTAIKAMQRLPENYFLILAGKGKEEKTLKKLSKEINIQKKVLFLGTRSDVATLLHQSDLFILPSVKEGMSNSLLEAMAMGKTCVVSDISQNKELIKDGKTGRTFALYSEASLTRALKKGRSKKMENAAKEYIKKHHDIKHVAEEYKKIIRITG